ncbi:MAG: gephyrin-like molybdotransferase Glp [Candidatus Sulfotelmatobacter sp.]
MRVPNGLGSEYVSLSALLGRVAAENVIAEEDLVPYARSAMDGYALRASDTIAASTQSPVGLPVVGRVFAGEGKTVLAAGSVTGITTGAPVPCDADAVIPHEQAQVRDGTVFIEEPIKPGSCIFPPAEDVSRGETLLERGQVLGPALIALLAFVGRSRLHVYRRPRVSVLCTGSELVDVSDTPACGQVRNSNAYALMALLSQCGAEAQYRGTVADTRERLRAALDSAREGADLLLTTGGASVGERDLVKSVLESMGVDFEFRRVAIRPGKPFAFGMWGTLPVCVLPGNPSAAFVCFQEFVRPIVLRMAGRTRTELPELKATLMGRAKSKAGSCYIVLARTSVMGSEFLVRPLENQCSALVRNPAMANSLIVFPEGSATYEAGDQVLVQVLEWESAVTGDRTQLGRQTCDKQLGARH